MATSAVTTKFNAIRRCGNQTIGFGTITVGSGNYQNIANGGMVINFETATMPTGQGATFVTAPNMVIIQGVAGFEYTWTQGATAATGFMGIFQSAGSAAPLAELSNGGATPSGVTGDTISFVAFFDAW